MPTSKEWEDEENSSKREGNDQESKRWPNSFLSPEATVEVRKNYKETTIDLDLVKATGNF